MKNSRFTDSQIVSTLKPAEACTPVPELCREHGMSSATFDKWRAKYRGMDAGLMARMKELNGECPSEEDVCRRTAQGRNSAGSH